MSTNDEHDQTTDQIDWRTAIAAAPTGPDSERDRARLSRFSFLTHLRPVRVSSRAIAWSHTMGLGGSSLVLLVLLVLSGLLQMLFSLKDHGVSQNNQQTEIAVTAVPGNRQGFQE